MGFGFFVIAAGAAAGCYYGYRKLQQIEADIREELRGKGLAPDQGDSSPEQPPETPEKKPQPKPPTVRSLEDQILSLVRDKPGMLQTDLYGHFQESERKAVQAMLLKMHKAGVLKREKEKSTYKLLLP